MIDPEDPATELGEQQDDEISSGPTDPQDSITQVQQDQDFEIDPDAPDPR